MAADLARRVVAITGGAGGIGRALAAELIGRGARVALLDRPGPALDTAARELGALPVPCDVTDRAACDEAVGAVVDELGGLDVLVNNAGISHRSAFSETDADVLRRVMEVNFFGAVHCTAAALPHVVARRGSIVAVSSVAGFAPLVGRTGYAASKHALHGFFDSLRAELADTGVHVLLACPSFTRTAIRTSALGADGRTVGDGGGSFGRQLEPEDVARAIADAIVARRDQVLVGRLAHASWWLSRLAPRAYAAVMRRTQPGFPSTLGASRIGA